MPKLTITQSGNFDNLEEYLRKAKHLNIKQIFHKYGAMGVAALSAATPIESGLTADSWYYEIVEHPDYISLRWHNSHMVSGVPVVILLEYGHATRAGTLVPPEPFVMLAIKSIVEQVEADIGEEVTIARR